MHAPHHHPPETMKLPKCANLQLLLKLTGAVALLWMFIELMQRQPGWNPSYIFSYSWLDYIDDAPELAYSCSEILQGNAEEIEKAKFLSMKRDFRKSVQIPDEDYISATKDCRCVAARIK